MRNLDSSLYDVVPRIDQPGLRDFYELLADSQWWSSDRLAAYQQAQLERLLRHAISNVPFYRTRLEGLFSGNTLRMDQWACVPTLSRNDLRVHRRALHATEMPAGQGSVNVSFSSGSTGIPIQITVNRLAHLAYSAARWRCHSWHQLDWNSNLCAWTLPTSKVGQWPDGSNFGRWGPPWMEASARGEIWGIDWGETAAHLVEYATRNRCRYLNRGPKGLYALALECERLGLELELDHVLVQGERCGGEERSVFKRVFGAKTIEHYSSKEGGQIAHECDHGVLHLNEETHLVEILDEDDRPCPPGTPGRLVVTPLFSTAQPLIRYDQGDIAEFGGRCSCGRSSRTLRAIYGRSLAVFTHPSGETVCRFMPDKSRSLIGAGVWQFAQVGPTLFEVRYVKIGDAPVGGRETFLQQFREIYWEDVELRFCPLAILPLGKNGKHAEYINECPASSPTEG